MIGNRKCLSNWQAKGDKMENPVIETAKSEGKEGQIETLSTGIRAILHPVSARLIQSVMSKIPEPAVPWVMNEEKGKKEEDPFDVEYLAAKTNAAKKQAAASLDTFAMFGIELVDGLPENEGWLAQLQLFVQLGYLDLEEFDLEDVTTKEFLYKRYFALGSADIVRISQMSGLRKEAIDSAVKSFRS